MIIYVDLWILNASRLIHDLCRSRSDSSSRFPCSNRSSNSLGPAVEVLLQQLWTADLPNNSTKEWIQCTSRCHSRCHMKRKRLGNDWAMTGVTEKNHAMVKKASPKETDTLFVKRSFINGTSHIISLCTRIWFTNSASSLFWRFDQHADQNFSWNFGELLEIKHFRAPFRLLTFASKVSEKYGKGSTNGCIELIEPDAMSLVMESTAPWFIPDAHGMTWNMMIPTE